MKLFFLHSSASNNIKFTSFQKLSYTELKDSRKKFENLSSVSKLVDDDDS